MIIISKAAAMENYTVFPDQNITENGPIGRIFTALDIETFHEACRWVHQLPYGYNSDRDNLMILFKEKMGSCTTKHAVIATLASELNLPIHKNVGIYAMTEALVTGTQGILSHYRLPYIPMIHCFLNYQDHWVDLSEGNHNGKNGPIDHFLFASEVSATISAKDEYRLYRQALKDEILSRQELEKTDIKTVLKAREEGLALLKHNLSL
jgi:hypothetical protein